MPVTVHLLGPHEAGVLDRVADDAAALVVHGKEIGCHEAWVLTSPTNEAAKRMYRAAGSIPDEELSVMFTYRMRARADG